MKIDNFYTAFGFITAAFAEMEADLRSLIAGLAFGEDSVTAAVFLDSSQLAQNCGTLKKLGRKHRDYEERIASIVLQMNRIRVERNLFIHGIWDPGTFTKGGHATVRDLNSAYEEDDGMRRWTRGTATNYTLADFNTLLGKINAITTEIRTLCDDLENDGDKDFSHFGSVSQSRGTTFRIGPDFNLEPADESPGKA